MRYLLLLMTLVWAQICSANDIFLPYEDMRGTKSRTWEVGKSEVSSTPLMILIHSEEARLRIKHTKVTLPESFLERKEFLTVNGETNPLTALKARTVLEWEPIAKGHGTHKILTRPDVTLPDIISQDFNSTYFKGLGSLTLEAAPHHADLIKKIQIKSPNGSPMAIHGRFSPHEAKVTFCSLEDDYDLYKEISKSGFDARDGFLIVGASQVTLTF